MGKYVTLNYINDIGIKKVVYENKNGRKVYLLNNGYKFKEFPEDFRSMQDPDVKYVHDTLLEQSKLELKTTIVPSSLVVDNNNLYGYLAPFIEGQIIADIDPDFLIDILLKILKDMESDMKTLSQEGWQVDDLHDNNVLINKALSTGNIIDMDDYFKTKENVTNHNLKCLFNAVIYSVLPRIVTSKTMRNKIMNKYFILASAGRITTTEFLIYLLMELKQYITTGVTLEEIRKKL